MKKNISDICVFASSCNTLDKEFFNLAYDLGKEIAKNHCNIIYGGSNLGLMGEVTSSAHRGGSEIIGVMPEKLYNLGIHPGDCTKFILTKGMRERKGKMDELSQAVIALPGGFGTLEELSEMIVQKQLGYCNKPIVILNCKNYYDNLINFFKDIIKNNFAPQNTQDIYFETKSVKEAMEYINSYSFENVQYLSEKLIIK